jgi:hypothetical protein
LWDEIKAIERRLKVKPVKLTNPFAPTVKRVAEIVPQKVVARLTPQTMTYAASQWQ